MFDRSPLLRIETFEVFWCRLHFEVHPLAEPATVDDFLWDRNRTGFTGYLGCSVSGPTIPSGSTLGSLFVLVQSFHPERPDMTDIDYIRGEIERMRVQVGRQRKEILQLQRAGIPIASAEALLQRMLDKIDTLCIERDKLRPSNPARRKAGSWEAVIGDALVRR